MSHIPGIGKVRDEKKVEKSPKRDDSSISLSKKEMQMIDKDPVLRVAILRDKRKSEIASREMVQLGIHFLFYIRKMRRCSQITEAQRYTRFGQLVTTLYYTDGDIDYQCAKH